MATRIDYTKDAFLKEVRLGLEGKFDIMEPVLLESLRHEGEVYGLNFDEWLKLD